MSFFFQRISKSYNKKILVMNSIKSIFLVEIDFHKKYKKQLLKN